MLFVCMKCSVDVKVDVQIFSPLVLEQRNKIKTELNKELRTYNLFI